MKSNIQVMPDLSHHVYQVLKIIDKKFELTDYSYICERLFITESHCQTIIAFIEKYGLAIVTSGNEMMINANGETYISRYKPGGDNSQLHVRSFWTRLQGTIKLYEHELIVLIVFFSLSVVTVLCIMAFIS